MIVASDFVCAFETKDGRELDQEEVFATVRTLLASKGFHLRQLGERGRMIHGMATNLAGDALHAALSATRPGT